MNASFEKALGTIRRNLLKVLLPLTKEIGKLHSPYSHKQIKAKDYRQALSILKPGMVLLTRTYGELSSPLIPGPFKHGAIYVGNGFIVEATMAGVKQTDLIDFLLSKDVFCMMTPLFCDEEVMASAALYAISQVGAPYDYDFKSDNKAFYCFELTYAAYQEAMGGKSPWELRLLWGEPTVVSEDFLNATSKWKMIMDTRSTLAMTGIL